MSIMDMTHKLREWRRYRASVRALSQLSNRELADLGIVRSEIPFVARQGARG